MSATDTSALPDYAPVPRSALGPALTSLPIDVLRVLVGGLLLIFGLQWLRKAILRSGGLKAKHDELETYELQTRAARAAGTISLIRSHTNNNSRPR